MKVVPFLAVACLLASAPMRAQSPAEQTPPSTPVASAAASPVDSGHVLYPAASGSATPAALARHDDPAGMPGLAMSFLLLLVLCAGGFYFLRRQTGFALAGKGVRKLQVSESRSLGNRQFLVVVEYESERVLLGVTPGKIDYLCPLPFKESAT